MATSGNLGPAVDASRELQFELDKILTFTTDNHEAHIQTHTRLMATPWMRKPELAQKLGIANAAAIQQNVMAHIQEHMQDLAGNQVDSTAATAGGQHRGHRRWPAARPAADRTLRGTRTPTGAAAAWCRWTDRPDRSSDHRHHDAVAAGARPDAARIMPL